MKNSRPLLFLLCLVGLLRTASAQAQTARPSCASNVACLSLFEQAQQQSKSGNLAEAQRLYKLAYEVQPDPALLFSVARVLHKQGQAREAIPYYRRFLDSGIDAEAQKSKAREYLAEIESTAPAVADPVTPAEVQVVTPPVSVPNVSDARKPLHPSERKPIYKKWWLWTIVGTVAAAGIAGGIAGGLIASQNQIPEPSFRPF